MFPLHPTVRISKGEKTSALSTLLRCIVCDREAALTLVKPQKLGNPHLISQSAVSLFLVNTRAFREHSSSIATFSVGRAWLEATTCIKCWRVFACKGSSLLQHRTKFGAGGLFWQTDNAKAAYKLFFYTITTANIFKVARNEVKTRRLHSDLRIVMEEYGDRN